MASTIWLSKYEVYQIMNGDTGIIPDLSSVGKAEDSAWNYQAV